MDVKKFEETDQLSFKNMRFFLSSYQKLFAFKNIAFIRGYPVHAKSNFEVKLRAQDAERKAQSAECKAQRSERKAI